jgi:hypothetical protein
MGSLLRSRTMWLWLTVLAAGALACSSGATQPEDPKSGECASCHMSEFRSAKDHEGKRPTYCGVCHSLDSWHPSRVDHAFWPLTGAHVKAECSYCHHGDPPVFHGNPKECVACHRDDFDKAPRHQRFSTACADCHGTEAWKPTLPGVDAGSRTPEPSETATSGATPDTIDDAGADGSQTSAPKPRPPRPRPKPTATPSALPTGDPITGGSRRLHP